MSTDRLVVVLCGPPGAGKTTTARANPLGLTIYDADDPQWASEQQFTKAIARLRADRTARAVVVRSAATSSARTRWRALVGATHCYVIATDQQECATRVRGRARPDRVKAEVAAVAKWWAKHERADRVRDWSGWQRLGEATTPPQPLRPLGKRREIQAKYETPEYVQAKAAWRRRLDAGEAVHCPRCGRRVTADSWDLGHDDAGHIRGPEHPRCNRGAGAREATKVRTQRQRAWTRANASSEQQLRRW